ncbi:MAG: excisionase, partial [Oscillospiraceae bacterium]|nr:excisionase [Oscillospiraceae bacterium]
MEYTLMHKNVAVAVLEIFEDTGTILKTTELMRPEHLPLGVRLTPQGKPETRAINDWWTGRAIPASRSGLRDALEVLQMSSPVLLLTKCFGLSLSDQYWVRPSNKRLEWTDVNFFENEFSEDVGNALFGRAPDGELDLMSPDNTSDGWLKKKWVVADGKRLLIKGGSGPYYQEPLNEVIASAIMRRLGIAHATYTPTWDGDQPLSACEDFITPQTDLVSAWHIRETGKKPGHVSEYQHFIERCG